MPLFIPAGDAEVVTLQVCPGESRLLGEPDDDVWYFASLLAVMPNPIDQKARLPAKIRLHDTWRTGNCRLQIPGY